jgi:hypothetical protein
MSRIFTSLHIKSHSLYVIKDSFWLHGSYDFVYFMHINNYGFE